MTGILQHVTDALSLGGLYALFALGLALIFGIMRLVNFAHGELIMIAAYVAVLLSGLPWPVMVVLAVAATVAGALAMERVAFRPLRGAQPATLLVASFAVSYLLQNLLILIEGSAPKSANISQSVVEPVDVAGVSVAKIDILTIVLTAGLLLAVAGFLSRTSLGLQMRAAAADFTMARFLGVKANRVLATAFAVSGLLAAIGALLLVARTGNVSPTIGLSPLLAAFIAAVVGGMTSLVGAVLGGYLLGAMTVGWQIVLPLELRSYRDAFVYAFVIVILIVRPDGIIVPKSARTRV